MGKGSQVSLEGTGEEMGFSWLTIELTNRCNKSCNFCGRAKIRDKMELGDMDFDLFKHILKQFNGEIIQFSRDGDPLCYRHFDELSAYMWAYYDDLPVTNIVTNGKLLLERRNELLNAYTTITVSVIEEDWEQFNIVKKFKEYVDLNHPIIYVKFLGDYYNPEYEKLGLRTMRRTLHNPEGDWDYQKGQELLPEIGVCADFLMKPSINWKGEFFICNRFDPGKKGMIGDVKTQTLDQIWNNEIRQEWLNYHKIGRRDLVSLCKDCQFWGVPRYK